VLLVNVHQLKVVLRNSVVLAVLKNQAQRIGRVLGLERHHVLILRRPENLLQRNKVDSERDVTVTAVESESFRLKVHGDKRDVGVVHSLELDSGVIAVEVAVLNEVLDGIDDLGGGLVVWYRQ
jgi:hypothetical protein